MFNLKKLFLLLLLFINNSIISEGFIAGTLVKTKSGYVSIEQLKENDSVTAYSFKNKELYECKILKIKKQHYDKSIKIKANGHDIICAPDHKFYLPLHSKKKWIVASGLKPKDSILRNIKELIQVDEVIELEGSDFYSLSIDKHHNFFVTHQDILVHNFAWTVPVFEIVIGGGFRWLLGWNAIGSALFGIGSAYIISKNGGDISHFENLHPDKKEHIFYGEQGEKHGFSGGPNDEDPDKWWEKVIKRVKEAYTNGELPNKGRFELKQPQDVNPFFGDLVIKGVVNSGIIQIGTAFLQRK